MKATIHWCSLCDAKQVDSTKPETGTFYNVFGHEWTGDSEWNGEYKSILFALCPDCSPEAFMKNAEKK